MSADYPQLTEDEKYAIFANIPYQIHEGVPIEVIEEELRAYGLDHNIDEELSDRVGVILHNDDEMIHSVRGTDFTNARDLVSDLGLILGNPTFVKGAKTLALAEQIPYALHDKFLGNPFTYPSAEFVDDVRPLISGRLVGRDYLFSQKMSDETPANLMEIIETQQGIIDPDSPWFNEEIYNDPEELQQYIQDTRELYEDVKEQIPKALTKRGTDLVAGLVGGYVGAKALAKAGGSLPEYLRIKPERERLQKALDKHSNKTPSLTGHSLGSVVNVLGRENNIKTISFNPAPQGGEDIKRPHHKDSKVYRIKGDIVSFKGFRTPEDTEPVIEFEPRYGSSFLHYHKVNQFIPDKPKPQIAIPLYSPVHYRPTMYNNKIRSVEFDFCKYNPDNPKCIKISREKEYY